MTSSVASRLATAFAIASQQHPTIDKSWTEASARLGGLLPRSLLSWAIQNAGTFDVALRSLEDEAFETAKSDTDIAMSSMNLQLALSDMWIGSMYEIGRTIRARALVLDESFLRLVGDLELVRVAVEKHEVPKDQKIAAPIRLGVFPLDSVSEEDVYEYRRSDPLRSYIVPRKLSDKGSCSYYVFDHLSNTSRWLERRSMSDRFLELTTKL